MNGILHGGKTLREKILKNISVCEIHYSKYQLIKSMYKIITSVCRDTAKLKVFKKSAL